MDEAEEWVEVIDRSFATIADNMDTMRETIPTLPQPDSIANLMIMLLRSALFYNLSGKKRDCRWEIGMYS